MELPGRIRRFWGGVSGPSPLRPTLSSASTRTSIVPFQHGPNPGNVKGLGEVSLDSTSADERECQLNSSPVT